MTKLRSLSLMVLLLGSAGAEAGELGSSFAPPNTISQFEVRFGALAHGLGSVENRTVDLNLELVSPRLFRSTGAWWDVFIPRAYVGGAVNLGGRTNSLRAGASWLFPFTKRLFGEIYFGGAVHDGSLAGDATHNALGSRGLFNVGGSLGYRFAPQWSVMGTFDHLSNGNRVFGTGFARNQGLNSVGARLSYAF